MNHVIMQRFIAGLLVLLLAAATEAQTSDWYVFNPASSPDPGEIGLTDWLDKPAGERGRIVHNGDKLLYGGQPIKLWGLNLCFAACVPSHETAEKRAAFYPKFGINTVRLHKFTESDYQTGDSAIDYSADAIDRMDYQIAKFKEAGIYVTLSVHFGPAMLGSADRKFVPWIDEIGDFSSAKRGRIKTAHSTIFFSPEIQKLHAAQMVNLLKHRNKYTGLTYADEPAIAFIECVNEQSILFYTSMGPLKSYATLRKQVGERFSAWLKAKYETEQALLRAWGPDAMDCFVSQGFAAGESLSKRNILPLGSPFYWDDATLKNKEASRKQRHLDTLEFLTMLQSECYANYATALREAGYLGELLGSNWQAGRSLSHYANLHTDWEMGTIDRHNYFGGFAKGEKTTFRSGSMLSKAGTGMLSSGLQQVGDRPFMLSEWIHVFPNEWGAEGPAIIGAYGLGLQGWDVSYMFQNGDDGQFSRNLGSSWDVTAPQVLGIFPGVARQVLRGDVKESDVLAVRNVCFPSLLQGKLGFEDVVKQGYDDKELDSAAVPARTLAVARAVVNFTEADKRTPSFDLKPYEQGDALVSSTGQLRWTEGKTTTDGFFTINSSGTKAVVGFAQGQRLQLGEVIIQPESRFAAIYVSAQGQADSISAAKRMIVVAMARARNTAMQIDEPNSAMTAKGRAPVLLESVKARITLNRSGGGIPRVIVLDQDGRRTENTITVTDGSFTIDGTRDKTPYYLIEYP